MVAILTSYLRKIDLVMKDQFLKLMQSCYSLRVVNVSTTEMLIE